MLLRSLLFISVLLNCSLAFAQANWQLNKSKNGIKVYTAKESSSKFKWIKVEAVMEGTVQELMNVLMNVNSNQKWVYNTRQTYLVKKVSDNEITYYAETALPAPINNRDIVIRMTFYPNNADNTLRVKAQGVQGMVPERENIVRVPYFEGDWIVKYLGNNRLNITYFLKTDPGGSIPAWISNLFIARGPYETFYNLSVLLKK